MDDSTRPAVLDALGAELARLLDAVVAAGDPDLGEAERTMRVGVLAVGGRLLAAGLAARGAGKAGPRVPCPCGAEAAFEGYRPKGVQTLVGWIEARRAYYRCPACGHGWCPLDAALGLERDGHTPGVRRLVCRLGALLPLAQATATVAETAGVRLSASTVRGAAEAVGARREAEQAAAERAAWRTGVPPADAATPARLYVAMDGVRILGADGDGKEAKAAVVRPATPDPAGETRAPASYAAGFQPAEAFGDRRLVPRQRADTGAGPGAARSGDGRGGGLGRRPTARAAGGAGRRVGRGVAGIALPGGGRRRPRRASRLLRQPGESHGLRPLPGARPRPRLGHGRGGVHAPDRRPRERAGHALAHSRRERGRPTPRPPLQPPVGRCPRRHLIPTIPAHTLEPRAYAGHMRERMAWKGLVCEDECL